MESRAVAAVTLGFLLAAAPVAAQSAQPATQAEVTATSSPATLYFHLLGVEDFPINTQEPDPAWTEESLYGATTATATCLSGVAGNTGGFGNEYHTYYGIPFPALMNYDQITGGTPTVAPQRGLGADVEIDAGVPATLTWYVSSGSSLGAGGAPMPVPNVVLRATVRPSDAISVDDEAYNAGDVVMSGASRPATLVGPAALGPDGQPAADVKAVGQVNGRWVYEFTLPMQVNGPSLLAATGFNVRMDLFVENPSCADPGGQGYAMPNVVGMHSSAAYRPRLELGVVDPMWASMRAEMQGGHLIVLASIGSVWGAYDVDATKAVLVIDGPADTGADLAPLEVDDSGYGDHMVRSAKVMAWLWPDAIQAENGRYSFSLSVPNLQGTATAQASTEFAIAPDGEAPGPALPLLVLAVLGAALLLRRR